MVVYHLLGKTGWSTIVVNNTRQIPNGNFHFHDFFPEDGIKDDPSQKARN